MTLGNRLFLLILFATFVVAADDAEFAFNLLSDIAPILALFGDQFARQFTSESLTWVDHFIFAMVPLGIITAITGAIRVQGMPLARAFIGRARENRALVEIELMSSTSREVCEIFNGSSIVRAMGDPKIAQFLIFPEKYKKLENDFRSFDQDSMNSSTVERPTDTSCGIYSLEEAKKVQLVYRNEYRGKSSIFLQDPWVSRASTPEVVDLESVREHDTVDSSSPPKSSNPHLPALSPPESSDQLLDAVDERLFRNPPNIQLNLSSDHFDPTKMDKGGEIFLAAMIGFLLQTGLIAIAAVTAYRVNSSSSSFLQSSVYGFPCYAAGSFLLCCGTGICSLIVEHSTDEYSWEFPPADVDKAPRILWLQQKQRVNDQSFNGYVISSGPKRRVITSSRRDASKERFWEVLAVGAALSAGLGFTAQFMGLRGLAFPCSIAQLGAIFVMALVRSGIRRRLGHRVKNYSAAQWYEIDFLAAKIVLDPQARVFDDRSAKRKRPLSAGADTPEPEDYFEWKINTPNLKDTSPLLVPLESQVATNPRVTTIVDNVYPTSQQLLRVRKRLSDLTKWKTRSSASAMALVQSIRLVMNTFLPASKEKPALLKPVTWLVYGTFSESTGRQDLIKIPITYNKSNSGWELDPGLIDAIISLWMASIDVRKSNAVNEINGLEPPMNRKQRDVSKKADWRFGKDEDTLRYSFYRIIGDNLKDGVLQRDLSWWADSVGVGEVNSDAGTTRNEELIIGFNGIKHEYATGQLGISGEAPLPTILAQHLFTSFMWTVAQHLPKDCLDPTSDQGQKEVEVEGAHTFESYNFKQTWRRLRLRHRRLTELVRQLESLGMGSTHDILLCMIPALSFKRLLPNQEVLKLIPHVGSGRLWAETASCHRHLLKTIHDDEYGVRGRLDISIVTTTMDFLSFACEPYGEHIGLPSTLNLELSGIVENLCSPVFADLMEKLAPVYRQQRRQSTFKYIFSRFQYVPGVSDYVKKFTDSPNQTCEVTESISENTFESTFGSTFGFNQYHKLVFAWEADIRSPDDYDRIRAMLVNERSTLAKDVFGWTPFHYMSMMESSTLLLDLLEFSDTLKDTLPNLLCAYSRTPIHLAALGGIRKNLEPMLERLNEEQKWHIFQSGGIDGMTPLHLIAKHGHLSCLDLVTLKDRALIEDGELSTEPIISNSSYLNKEKSQQFLRFAMASPTCRYSHGRTFLHSAVEIADPDTIGDLIKRQFDLNAKDNDGRTPLHYAILGGRENMAILLINGFDLATSSENGRGKKHIDASLSAGDFHGTTALMFAVEKKLKEVVKTLLSKQESGAIDQIDDDSKTALFYANDLAMVVLLVGHGCNTTAKNSIGRTRLHTAINEGQEKIALYLLQLKTSTQVQDRPWDDRGESLLITVCRCGLSALVDPIHEKWGNLLEQGDTDYEQSPLGWACDAGHTDVVKELLKFDIDFNRPAFKMNNLTPLHFSAMGNKLEIMDLLLNKESTNINQRDSSGATALDRAISYRCIGAARKLLLHDQTVFSQRVKALKSLIPTFTKTAPEEAMALVSDGLMSIKDEELIRDFLVWLVFGVTSQGEEKLQVIKGTAGNASDIEPEDRTSQVTDQAEKTDRISANANQARARRSVEAFLTPLMTDIIQQGWESIGNPYELVMLLSDDGLRETVKRQQLDDKGFDRDMWSCVDYIERFDRNSVMKTLIGRLKQAVPKSEYMKPAALSGAEYEESIRIHPCTPHGKAGKPPRSDSCNQIHEIEVVGTSDEYYRACIRSEHCIPPSSKGFYFEVEVLENSWSGIICIGFCGVDTGDGECPGWFTQSWAYHGDDGGLFIESGSAVVPSDDFGVSGTFGEGDTVGAGLDMTTGQGFCTLNGTRLNMGKAFEPRDERFLFGKLYPCVGFDLTEGGIGLCLRVNLDQSIGHPSKYPRPFNSS
ncbi:hypothetical protein FAVG1_06823 [Fusarium avenaceum]|nr:hypothetical protein FAVG1_06823 [Fusarium avenaceum]